MKGQEQRRRNPTENAETKAKAQWYSLHWLLERYLPEQSEAELLFCSVCFAFNPRGSETIKHEEGEKRRKQSSQPAFTMAKAAVAKARISNCRSTVTGATCCCLPGDVWPGSCNWATELGLRLNSGPVVWDVEYQDKCPPQDSQLKKKKSCGPCGF